MGKALLAVGGFLAACFIVFGGAVFLTRDEDTIAVDSTLAEEISKAIATASQRGGEVDLRALTPFDWDRMYVFPIGTPRRTISEAVGFPFKGDLPYTAESSEVMVFTNLGRFVRFADYRGRLRWEGFRRPAQEVDANDATLHVEDGIVRPVRPLP